MCCELADTDVLHHHINISRISSTFRYGRKRIAPKSQLCKELRYGSCISKMIQLFIEQTRI
ncbi:MAG: hypothetical protein ACRC10_10725 [Thermoguttaceae bacterium]